MDNVLRMFSPLGYTQIRSTPSKGLLRSKIRSKRHAFSQTFVKAFTKKQPHPSDKDLNSTTFMMNWPDSVRPRVSQGSRIVLATSLKLVLDIQSYHLVSNFGCHIQKYFLFCTITINFRGKGHNVDMNSRTAISLCRCKLRWSRTFGRDCQLKGSSTQKYKLCGKSADKRNTS